MAPRLDLDNLLREILGSDSVYFQPPPSLVMTYPAIVYKRDQADTDFANNKPYRHEIRYQVTVIDPDPDSEIPSKIAALPKCLFDRFYTAKQLNHDVYNLYF